MMLAGRNGGFFLREDGSGGEHVAVNTNAKVAAATKS